MSVICGIEDRLYSSFEKDSPPLQGGQSRGRTVTQGVALGWSPPRRWRELDIERETATNDGGQGTRRRSGIEQLATNTGVDGNIERRAGN
jgi:hypothetical protein